MKALFPVAGRELKLWRRGMTRERLKSLGSEIVRGPVEMITILRRFRRLHSATNILMDGSKIMQFGGWIVIWDPRRRELPAFSA